MHTDAEGKGQFEKGTVDGSCLRGITVGYRLRRYS